MEIHVIYLGRINQLSAQQFLCDSVKAATENVCANSTGFGYHSHGSRNLSQNQKNQLFCKIRLADSHITFPESHASISL